MYAEDDPMGKLAREEAIPADMAEEAEAWRTKLVEAISETDDVLMGKYLEGEIPTADELKVALRKAVISNHIVPLWSALHSRTKAYSHFWMQLLTIFLLLKKPSQSKAGLQMAKKLNVRAMTNRLPDWRFKVMTDPFVGKLTFVRVYSGTLTAGSYVQNTTKGRKERISRLIQLQADQRTDVQSASAGDIVAVVGLKDTTTGDTLAVDTHPIILESMNFPDPVISVAIEPKTKQDSDRLGNSLARLAEEDPTFKVKVDHETGQTIIAGMGELHWKSSSTDSCANSR